MLHSIHTTHAGGYTIYTQLKHKKALFDGSGLYIIYHEGLDDLLLLSTKVVVLLFVFQSPICLLRKSNPIFVLHILNDYFINANEEMR